MSNKIAVFGTKVGGSKFMELKRAANRLGVSLDLISFNDMMFDTTTGDIKIRNHDINAYDVYFFRNVKNRWEDVNLILGALDKDKIIVDPIVKSGRQSDICKAYQMTTLSRAGLPVPRTIYGSLDYLTQVVGGFSYPLIIKGSRGDKRTSVYKIFGRQGFNRKIEELRESEENGENKYMIQEYIRNRGDYRIMVVGDKVLGVMSRAIGDNPRRRDDFTQVELPDNVKNVALQAAKACGVMIAGVDIILRNGNTNYPLILEVNKTPNYDRFVETTRINVAEEVVKMLADLKKE